jgi:hypothetical protein
MRKAVVFIFTLILVFNSYAQQQVSENTKYKSIDVNLRLIDKIPYEICFKNIDSDKHFGFQFKFSMGNFQPSYTSVNTQSNYQQGGLSIDYSAFAFVFKPGVTFVNLVNKNSVSFLGASLNLAYTIHSLDMNFTDPIYGKVSKKYQDYVIYPGAEFECAKIYRLGKRMSMNLSIVTGYALPHQPVLDYIIQGMNSGTNSYTPGQGFGTVYINFLAGMGCTF